MWAHTNTHTHTYTHTRTHTHTNTHFLHTSSHQWYWYRRNINDFTHLQYAVVSCTSNTGPCNLSRHTPGNFHCTGNGQSGEITLNTRPRMHAYRRRNVSKCITSGGDSARWRVALARLWYMSRHLFFYLGFYLNDLPYMLQYNCGWLDPKCYSGVNITIKPPGCRWTPVVNISHSSWVHVGLSHANLSMLFIVACLHLSAGAASWPACEPLTRSISQ